MFFLNVKQNIFNRNCNTFVLSYLDHAKKKKMFCVCSAELPFQFAINLYLKPLLRASWGADLGHTFSA